MDAPEAKPTSLLYHAIVYWRTEASICVVRRINEAQEEIEAKDVRYQPKRVR